MPLLFIKEWLTPELVRALCWTFVHSLWQGLLLVIVTGAVVLLTKRATAALRYNLLATLFLIFLLVVGGTFLQQWNQANHAEALNVSPGSSQTPGTILPASDNTNITATSTTGPINVERFIRYFNEHAHFVVALWFIFFIAKLVKLVAGIGYIQRIRHYRVQPPSGPWQARVKELAIHLRVRPGIRLLESGLVKVPVVVGMLKPVILMPVGLLTNLPADQVEAILLHELAHIRRKDYFINLLQTLGEAVLFFNPAVLWLSALIREERENCCDDMAIGITNNRKKFVSALVSFQEYKLQQTGYAMGFPGRKNQLLKRVKRIIHNNNQSLNTMERTFLGACLFITVMLTLFYMQGTAKETSSQQAGQYQIPTPTGMQPEFQEHKATKPASAPLHNTTKPAAAVSVPDTAIKPVPGKPAADPRPAPAPSKPVGKKDAVKPVEPVLKLSAPVQLDSSKLSIDTHYDLSLDSTRITTSILDETNISVKSLGKLQSESQVLNQQRTRLNKENMRLDQERKRSNADRNNFYYKANKPIYKSTDIKVKPYAPHTNITDQVLNELLNEKVITDKNADISVELTQSVLRVNGVQQPANLHQKLRNRYLPEGEWRLNRNTNNNNNNR